jgi:D-threo-aldose 1-dehydrogenase
MKRFALGNTSLRLPRIVFGTSCLGNLYAALPEETKRDISRAWLEHVDPVFMLDTAGKYGAGLALESIGENLRRLEVPAEHVVISNKLGWKRVPLRTADSTFEPGIWADLEHDAELCISYDGILDCWRQGNELLGAPYTTQLVSVHDPDEYLGAAKSLSEKERRLADILEAYRALNDLKKAGHVMAVGIGSKDWHTIRCIADKVPLDWVMLANSLTILRHPPELVQWVSELAGRGVAVINSAVFHAGFLTGGQYFDYRLPSPESDRDLFAWREMFHSLCRRHDVSPMHACVQFALSPPGVVAIALNTSRPGRIVENVAAVEATVPQAFWADAKKARLIAPDYPHVG